MSGDNDAVASPGAAEPVGAHSRTVRAVAAFGLPGRSTLTLPAEPLGAAAWSELVDAASTEGLLGLLLAAITADAFPVTAAQATQVQRLATESVAYCLRLEGELIRADAILRALDVPLRVLKGPAAARLEYPDPTMRSFMDIDLLIRSEDFDRAVAGLTSVGYQRRRPQLREGFDRSFGKAVCFRSPNGTPLDVHRTFVTGPFGLKVHLDDLWGPGAPFDVEGRIFLALPTEARLLHACYHAALGDGPPRLVPHRDVAGILLSGSSDESRVRELSSRWQADAVVAAAVRASWDLLEVSVSTGLSTWAQGYVPSRAERRALDLHRSRHANLATKSVAAVTAIDGLRRKGAFLRALALPDRGYITGRERSWAAHLASGLRQARARRRDGG